MDANTLALILGTLLLVGAAGLCWLYADGCRADRLADAERKARHDRYLAGQVRR
jgi:hypothetical protein